MHMLQLQLQPHYIIQHYAALITLHYTTTTTTTATTTTTTLHYTTLQRQLRSFTLQYARLHYTTLYHTTMHNTTVHYTTVITPHHSCNCNCNYTSYSTLHYIQQLWWGDPCNHCNHSKKYSSNHLSVHQRICSAIRDSQQPTSPIVSYSWNFRHRLVRHYWYRLISYVT